MAPSGRQRVGAWGGHHADDSGKLPLMSKTPTDPFADVDGVWRSCFGLAWEAFQARSIPVGAVLVDADGETIRSGRNRSSEKAGPAGQVVGSNIAHAEINALATLPPGDYADHILYSTLEPCLLCTAALRHSHVGVVRFAAADPMWQGIDRLPELSDQLARRWPRREGPLGGHLQTWAALLPLVSAVERGIVSVQQSHAATMPAVLSLARTWAGETANRLRGLDLHAALAVSWTDVATCQR
jgi:tRNA(Arg) A34 adenosine deaminase TadA